MKLLSYKACCTDDQILLNARAAGSGVLERMLERYRIGYKACCTDSVKMTNFRVRQLQGCGWQRQLQLVKQL